MKNSPKIHDRVLYNEETKPSWVCISCRMTSRCAATCCSKTTDFK